MLEFGRDDGAAQARVGTSPERATSRLKERIRRTARAAKVGRLSCLLDPMRDAHYRNRMVLLSFNAIHVDAVASGQKRRTIRKTVRAKPGDRLQLYTGIRTKHCRKLVDPDPVCLGVEPVEIYANFVRIGGQMLTGEQLHRFALDDGFTNFGAMVSFFTRLHGRLPFTGFMHRW